jgi:hypothetical protein
MVHVLDLAQRKWILDEQREPAREAFLRDLHEEISEDGTKPPDEPRR